MMMTSSAVFMTMVFGVFFILILLASQESQCAKLHFCFGIRIYKSIFEHLIYILFCPCFIYFRETRNSRLINGNYNFHPLYIRRWFFVSVAVQSFVHLLLWRPPEGFFSTLPFLRSYVILVWSWQQRSALLVSHTVASFL